jgi:hypothetical protein
MLMSFVPGFTSDSRQPVAHRTDRSPEIGQLEAEDHVCVGNERPRVAGLIERMARREIHAPALIDDRRLQRLGERDEMSDSGRRSCGAIGDEHRVLCVDEQTGRFGNRA